MSEKTTVVVVNWNGEKFLPALLDSLREQDPARTIVVDNASSDDSRKILEARKEVELIANPDNRGFGAAANQGIAAATTPYVLLLNADLEVLPDCLKMLEQFLDENAGAAIAAPQLLFPDGRVQPSCRTFPSIWKKFLFLSYLDRLIPSGYRLPASQHRSLTEVDQPMGAAMLIRKKALEESGRFDPDFFLYMEEVDLCERIKKHGWKIFYVPDARVIHHAGGSSDQDWERTQTDYLRSVIRYFAKRFSAARLVMLRLSLSAALLIRSIVMIFKGKWRRSLYYLKMSPQILSLK